MIKVGDWVRVVRGYKTNNAGEVLEIEGNTAVVALGSCKLWASLDHLETAEQPIGQASLLQVPPDNWTPHDRYTAAALTGLLARGGDTVPIGGFVAVARQIADEAMAARGGR